MKAPCWLTGNVPVAAEAAARDVGPGKRLRAGDDEKIGAVATSIVLLLLLVPLMRIDIVGILSNDDCLPRLYPAFDARLRPPSALLSHLAERLFCCARSVEA